MTTLTQALSAKLGPAFDALGLEPALGRVERSARPDLAPFQCNGAMAAAKALKKNPREIAQTLADRLAGDPDIAMVEIAGPGFLNLTPTDAVYDARAAALAADPRAGAAQLDAPRRILIDFGGPNVAKPMHVGHVRSSVIGDCLQRLYRFRGDTVTSDVHLGDWGLQMGHLITELEDERPELPYFATDAAEPFPAESPVDLDDLARLYPQASAKAKADPARMDRSRKATAKLQAGHAGYRALLAHFIAVSKAGLKRDFARMGVFFVLWKGEADAESLIPDMVADLKARGVAELSEGAWIIRVAEPTDKKELAPMILVSSEGAALYGTTDLATILDRKQALDPDLSLYVVDQRQREHFEQVFRAAEKAGYGERARFEHVGFGTVNGPDGKPFKTREGGVMRLADLLAMAEDAARSRLAEAGLGQDLGDDGLAAVARQVGLAAIKFADLQNQRTTNYVFDLDRFTAFEGKTGPYLLYAAVRVKSVLRKAAEAGVEPGPIAVRAEAERGLVLALDGFERALAQAYDKKAPHILCDHAYGLATAFSSFYANCPILGAETDAAKGSRLALAALALRQLERTLDILGLEAPERM
ncbi:MAG: arginine--tRNA ligase [Maricaulaceae bacterium]